MHNDLRLLVKHHQNELVQKILEIQHDAKVNIMCNTHVHVSHENCLETIMVTGKVSEVKDFAWTKPGLY